MYSTQKSSEIKKSDKREQEFYTSHFFNKMKTKPKTSESKRKNVSEEIDPNLNTNDRKKKKSGRFNGMSEEQVSRRTIPDHLLPNLDIIVIGINPGLVSAYEGHHYAGTGNHFWKCLHLSGLTERQMSPREGYKLPEVGIGLTNMVARATKGIADLTRKEMKEGAVLLLEKLRKLRPKIAVFNGKLIYEVFSEKKDFNYGKQPERIDGTNTCVWVMPSSSPRGSLLPRAEDKVPFYSGLKKFRDFLDGAITSIDESEVVFAKLQMKAKVKRSRNV